MPAPEANGCSVGSMRHASGTVPEQVDDLLAERDLLLDREVPGEERVVDLALPQLGDQRNQLRLDLGEDPRHVRRLRLRLEVVEQDVVRLVGRVEAGDVAAAQLDGALERGQEQLEVRRHLRLEPDRGRIGGGPRHLAGELGGHAHGLVVLAPGEADQRGVVGVRVERVLERAQLLDEAAHLGIDQRLMAELLEHGQVRAAARRAGRRHDRPLVPDEQRRDRSQGLDLLEATLELDEGV